MHHRTELEDMDSESIDSVSHQVERKAAEFDKQEIDLLLVMDVFQLAQFKWA